MRRFACRRSKSRPGGRHIVRLASPHACAIFPRENAMKTSSTLMAMAIGAALLTACHHGDDGTPVKVDQLNNLKGPTRDLAVELNEGTNMAASPSPDGKR